MKNFFRVTLKPKSTNTDFSDEITLFTSEYRFAKDAANWGAGELAKIDNDSGRWFAPKAEKINEDEYRGSSAAFKDGLGSPQFEALRAEMEELESLAALFEILGGKKTVFSKVTDNIKTVCDEKGLEPSFFLGSISEKFLSVDNVRKFAESTSEKSAEEKTDLCKICVALVTFFGYKENITDYSEDEQTQASDLTLGENCTSDEIATYEYNLSLTSAEDKAPALLLAAHKAIENSTLTEKEVEKDAVTLLLENHDLNFDFNKDQFNEHIESMGKKPDIDQLLEIAEIYKIETIKITTYRLFSFEEKIPFVITAEHQPDGGFVSSVLFGDHSYKGDKHEDAEKSVSSALGLACKILFQSLDGGENDAIKKSLIQKIGARDTQSSLKETIVSREKAFNSIKDCIEIKPAEKTNGDQVDTEDLQKIEKEKKSKPEKTEVKKQEPEQVAEEVPELVPELEARSTDTEQENLNSIIIGAMETGELLILDDIKDDHYHGSIGISSSQVKSGLKSMMYFNAKYNSKDIAEPDTSAFAVGRLTHAMILQSETVDRDFILAPKFDKRTKQGKADFAEFELNAKGKTIIKPEEWEIAEAMTSSAINDPDAKPFLTHKMAATERSYWAVDPDTGLTVKVRPDIELGHIVGDVKTIQLRGNPDEDFLINKLRYEIQQRDYDLSAAMYLSVTGKKQFVWIFINKEAGYNWVAVIKASNETLENGYRKYRTTLDKIADCYDSGRWPKPKSIQKQKNPETGKYELPEI